MSTFFKDAAIGKKLPEHLTLKNTLVIIACSSTKLVGTRLLYELYDGPMWRCYRRQVKGYVGLHRTAAISGRYGIANAHDRAYPSYNMRMTRENATALAARGLYSAQPWSDGEGFTEPAIYALQPHLDCAAWEAVVVAAGADYRVALDPLLLTLRAHGHVKSTAQIICTNGKIGYQLGQFKRIMSQLRNNTPPL